MKIAHLNTYDINGGAARAAFRLHKGLLRCNQESTFIVADRISTEKSVLKVIPNVSPDLTQEALDFNAIQERYINSNRTDITNTFFSFPYPGYDVAALGAIQEADIINLHWLAKFQSPVTLNKLLDLKKPLVWTLHDQWPLTGGCHYSAGCAKYRGNCSPCPQLKCDPFHMPSTILQDKVQLFSGANITIVSPSQWLGQCAKESAVFKSKRVEIIPYSLDTEVFAPVTKENAKTILGINPNATTLLFGAHTAKERRKGFNELVAAIHVCNEFPEFKDMVDSGLIKVLLFGYDDGDLKNSGLPAVSLGFLSADEQIAVAYSAADMFILPSLEDNLPNTVLESMSCGTPVVAFAIGGIPDLVTARTGILVPKCDVRRMGEAILSLVFDKNKRRELGESCRNIMTEKYKIEVQAKKYISLYEELSRQPSRSSCQRSMTKVRADETGVTIDTGVGGHFKRILPGLLKYLQNGRLQQSVQNGNPGWIMRRLSPLFKRILGHLTGNLP